MNLIKQPLLVALILPLLSSSALAYPRAQRARTPNKRLAARPVASRAEAPLPAPETTAAPTPVPGALIRTEGLGFKVEAPVVRSWVHSVDGGDKIAYDPNKGYALTNHAGVFTGPKDTLPPPNPGTTSGDRASGNNTITPNR